MVLCSSVRSKVRNLWFLSHDGLNVSGNHFRRVRNVDMKHDFAFVVRISYLHYNHFSCSTIYCVTISYNYKPLLSSPPLLFFCIQDFSDPRDADDARYHLDGRQFDGSRIVVEFAKGVHNFSFLRTI